MEHHITKILHISDDMGLYLEHEGQNKAMKMPVAPFGGGSRHVMDAYEDSETSVVFNGTCDESSIVCEETVTDQFVEHQPE
jgi:hypothetical protein